MAAIEESKALMEAVQIADEADKKMQEKQEQLEKDLEAKKQEKAVKVAEVASKANPGESEFPDIFSKPGQMLPGILSKGGAGGFEEINISDDTKQKAQ